MPKILIRKGKKEFIPELDREMTTVKAMQYFVEDLNKDFHTAHGVISKKDLQKNGEIVKSSMGKEFIIFDANFSDKYKKLRKLPQTIPSKDIGLIIAETGVNKESKIVEAGLGSGALACALANISKEVTSYEIREDHIEVAQRNINDLELKNVTVKNKSIYDGIDEKNVDLIVFDLPEPWKAIEHASKALKIGGFLVSYSPTVPQVMDFVSELSKKDELIVVKTVEIVERLWEVEGRKVRPKSVSIGHSGFLTFVRKVLE